MIFAIAILCALAAMMLIYEMTPVSSNVRSQQFARVRGLAGADPAQGRDLPFWRLMLLPLSPLVDRFLPSAYREDIRRKLYWANFGGSWLGWNEVEYWGLCVAIGTAALVLLLPSNPLLAFFAGFLGVWYPGVMLGGTARKQERAIIRELPDALYLLSTMVAVGIVLPDGLRRLTEHRGTFATWLRLAISKSHGSDLIATLREEATLSRQPRLIAFATKLELIATKGAAGSVKLLQDLADDQSSEYRLQSSRRAKELSSQLTFPVLLCFFWPYLIIIAAPLFGSVLRLFV